MTNNINNYLQNKINNYTNLLTKLEVLNPITTIKRGYTITKINDKSITSINNIKKNDKIIKEFIDCKIESEVLGIYERKE